jgi:ketosteroid isomerase-like protein
MTSSTLTPDMTLRAIQDRIEITDVLYRYASTIDSFDHEGLRGTMTDDIVARYGNAEPLSGADAVTGWIAEMIAPVVWQHHLLSVYHVDVDGDDAKALVYHTSHQLFEDDPDSAKVLVGRYRNELRRTDEGWKISKLELELLWAESKVDAVGFFASIGGRGPIR